MDAPAQRCARASRFCCRFRSVFQDTRRAGAAAAYSTRVEKPQGSPVQRPITGYMQDEEQHWVALLSCGHRQHVRHNPPLVSRPWVLTAEGRAQHLGALLDCVNCRRFKLPEDFAAYKRTPEFSPGTIPAGLRKAHATRPGVWARIHVLQGRLAYRIEDWQVDTVLTPEHPGIVVPELPHSVEPLDGDTRFYVEFHAAPEAPRAEAPASPAS